MIPLLIVSVAGLGLLRMLSGGRAGPAVPTAQEEALPVDGSKAALSSPGQLAEAASEPDTGRTVLEQAAATQSAPTDQPEPEPEPEPGPSASGVSLRGELRFSGDGAPASGASFVIRHGGGRLVVTADSAGAFVSDAVLAPGVLELMHRKTKEPGPYQQRLRFEVDALTLESEPRLQGPVVLTLLRPASRLWVRAVHLDGRPAAGTRVEAEFQRKSGPDIQPNLSLAGIALEDGMVGFALYDLEQLEALRLVALLEVDLPDGRSKTLVSRPHEPVLPLVAGSKEKPVRLVLDAAGSIRVRLEDQDGLAIPEQRFWLSSAGAFLTSWSGQNPVTDANGELLMDGLPPDTYRLGFVGRAGARRPPIEVHAGQVTEVPISIWVPNEEVAVSGMVLDEEGRPLKGATIHVRYGPRDEAGKQNESIVSDASGKFVFIAQPCDGLTVASNRDLFGDMYAPLQLELPFGSTGVVFRRTAEVLRENIHFEVLDASTGERILGSLVMTYRAPNIENYAFHRPTAGLASPMCSRFPETTLVIARAGYRRLSITVADLLEQAPSKGLRQVVLERGLLRTLHFESDAEEGGLPSVAGVEVRIGSTLLGHSDEQGNLAIDTFALVEGGLSIRATGYEETLWMPHESLADLEAAYVWLQVD
ncbi:MAG: hypothetical protein ACI8QC_003133 [Planctomycetota bacterium]